MSNFWRLKCSRSIHVALILNFENCMFRVIWRRRGVRSRGASSNWMDSDPPKATGKKQRSGSKCPTNDGFQHFSGSKKLQFFVKIAEFSRKFALKNSEKVYEVGVRFSLEIRKRVWKWFETPRRLYSVEVPRELCGFCVFSRVFNSTLCVSFMRFHAKFEFQKCAGTSSSFRPYRV